MIMIFMNGVLIILITNILKTHKRRLLMPRGTSKKLAWQSPSPKANAAYQKSYKEIFTNKKETKRAIRAAVNQAKKFNEL
jgi:hypothetical protein